MHCGSTVTLSSSFVRAAEFRDTRKRIVEQSLAAYPVELLRVRWQGQSYALLRSLGSGETAKVFLAERMAQHPQRVVLKLAHSEDSLIHLQNEAYVLSQLQTIESSDAAYFSQRLPQLVGVGIAEMQADKRPVLVLRHLPGYWGSLADVLHSMRPGHPGMNPRHIVWIWRRILDILAFVHANGWAHGDLAPDHLLVHPRDHNVLIIGWGRVKKNATAAVTRDLMQSAWSVRALLKAPSDHSGTGDTLPGPLSIILRRACEDSDWCTRLGARGIDQALVEAAYKTFGPPSFLPFDPTSPY